MSVLSNAAIIGGTGYEIDNSLRFRASASAYLSRTPSSAGNRKTWTWSGWVKKANPIPSVTQVLFGSRPTTSSNQNAFISVNTSAAILLFSRNPSDVVEFTATTNAVFRDPSAWYHVLFYLDTTQSTEANRMALYVNGVKQAFSTATYPTLNLDCYLNQNVIHFLSSSNSDNYLDGYLSEINFIDGQALTPSYFGETNSDGVWVPKKYTGNGLSVDATSTSYAIASSENSGDGQVATNAFDDALADALADRWRNNTSQDGNINGNAWIGQNFGTAKDIRGIRILQGRASVSTEMVSSIKVEYSDDGSSWTTAVTASINNSTYAWQDITVPSSGSHQYWRILANSTSSSGAWIITELEMLPYSNTPWFGNNGFYLPFDDATSTTTLGYDRSGNSNNWTPSGISVTAGVTYDHMEDTPTENYCTLNPLGTSDSGITYSAANLAASSSNNTLGGGTTASTFGATTGKWYAELTVTANSNRNAAGIVTATNLGTARDCAWNFYDAVIYPAGTAFGAAASVNDVIGIAWSADAGSVEFFKNNTSQGTVTGLSTSSEYFFYAEMSASQSQNWNFGQRPFAYTPPTGFKALCTANLP